MVFENGEFCVSECQSKRKEIKNRRHDLKEEFNSEFVWRVFYICCLNSGSLFLQYQFLYLHLNNFKTLQLYLVVFIVHSFANCMCAFLFWCTRAYFSSSDRIGFGFSFCPMSSALNFAQVWNSRCLNVAVLLIILAKCGQLLSHKNDISDHSWVVLA